MTIIQYTDNKEKLVCLNKATAKELWEVLKHQHISYEYTLVHKLINEIQKLIDDK